METTIIKNLLKIQCIMHGNISMAEMARRSDMLPTSVNERNINNTWKIPDLEHVALQAFNCKLYVAFEYKHQVTTADSITDAIRIQCVISGDITQKELAKRCGWSPALLSQKMMRDRWRVKDLDIVADALDCKLIIKFIPLDSID